MEKKGKAMPSGEGVPIPYLFRNLSTRTRTYKRGWQSKANWRNAIRLTLGDKMVYSPLECKTEGYFYFKETDLTSFNNRKELALFLYNAYYILDPIGITINNLKVDLEKLPINGYIEMMSEAVDKALPSEMVATFEFSQKESRFRLTCEARYMYDETGELFDADTCVILDPFRPESDNHIMKSEMNMHGITYENIVKLNSWCIEYISFVYGLSTDIDFAEIIEHEHGLSEEECEKNLISLIEYLKKNEPLTDEQGNYEDEEFLERWKDGDEEFKYLINFGFEDVNFNEILDRHNRWKESNHIPMLAQMKMREIIANGVKADQREKTLHVVGKHLQKWCRYLQGIFKDNIKFYGLMQVYIEEIERIRTDHQIQEFFFNIQYTDAFNNCDELIRYRDTLHSIYSIHHESSVFHNMFTIRIDQLLYRDGIDIFEESKGDGFKICKNVETGKYEKMLINQEYKPLWMYSKIFSETAAIYCGKIYKVFRGERI